MSKFFELILGHVRCRSCSYKNCEIRKHPERKEQYLDDGSKIVVRCQKDTEKWKKSIMKY